MRNPYCSHISLLELSWACNPGSLVCKSLATPSLISKGKSCVHHTNSIAGVYWDLSQLSKASQTEEMMKEAYISVAQRPLFHFLDFRNYCFMILLLKKKKCSLKIIVGLCSSLLNQTEALFLEHKA